MEILYKGVSSFALPSPVGPGIATTDGITGAIQHAADFRRVTSTNPAVRGETVIVYLTGLGEVDSPPPAGLPASRPTPTLSTPQITIGGFEAKVLYAGPARLTAVRSMTPMWAP